jgi:hypothetical protein
MDIIGYEGLYKLTYKGLITNIKTNKIVKHSTNDAGYSAVKLTKDGKQKTHYVHKLLAEHFLPNPKNLKHVAFINKKDRTNDIRNLYWCPKSELNHLYEPGKKFAFYITRKQLKNKPSWKLDYKLNGERVTKTYKIFEEALYNSKLAREAIKKL